MTTHKKIIFFLFSIMLFSSVQVLAQFEKGDKLLNLGVGVNSYYSGGIPLHASFEVGVTDEVSIGAAIDYLTYNYRYAGSKYGFASTYIGFRGSYHFSKLLKLDMKEFDLYAGATAGFRSFNWRDNNNFSGLGNAYGNGVFIGIFAGGRYYFDPSFAVFGELGAGGSTNARLGITVRF